jgi:AcrR family transcriptional regulator
MHLSKKQIKEARIIDSAEKVFRLSGFKNAKMDDIAKESGITKVTLYAYYQSKENLYLAITYRAFQLLMDSLYETITKNKNNSGLDSVLAYMNSFMQFCEDNFLYSEAILDYFALIRSSSQGAEKARLTDAVQESIYFRKIQDLQNLPFKLSSQEIHRGQQDGSILNHTDPMFLSLHAWTQIVGYIKIINATGDDTIIFDIDLRDLKEYTLEIAKTFLQHDYKIATKYRIEFTEY